MFVNLMQLVIKCVVVEFACYKGGGPFDGIQKQSGDGRVSLSRSEAVEIN